MLQIGLVLQPVHQMFRLDDRAKQYPFALVETVPPVQNIILAGVAPLSIIISWALVIRPGIHKAHVTILGLIISLFFTYLLTAILKKAVGRPRPDMLSRCKPELGTPEHDLVSIAVCTQTNIHILNDGFRSFPSGHSSWAFSGLGYLSLFLAGQMHTYRPRADLARLLLTVAPLVGATLVALSRVADYRHDKYDVTFGSLLGLIVAYTTYRRYYRPLTHPKCDIPYSAEAERAILKRAKAKTRDLEQQEDAGEFELSASDASDDESNSYLLTHSGPSDTREHTGTAAPP